MPSGSCPGKPPLRTPPGWCWWPPTAPARPSHVSWAAPLELHPQLRARLLRCAHPGGEGVGPPRVCSGGQPALKSYAPFFSQRPRTAPVCRTPLRVSWGAGRSRVLLGAGCPQWPLPFFRPVSFLSDSIRFSCYCCLIIKRDSAFGSQTLFSPPPNVSVKAWGLLVAVPAATISYIRDSILYVYSYFQRACE